MVVEDAVDIQEGARKLHVGSLVCASGMVGERGARWKAAHVVPRDRLVCASLMAVDDVVNSLAVLKVLKGVPCSVKHMAVEKDAYLQAALKVPKGVRLSAKGTVVENVACLTVVGYALKACTEVQISVSHMVEERGVLFQAVPRAPVAGLIVVSDTVGENGVSLKTAVRALRAALTSARPTVVERGAAGARENARNLLGERAGCVLLTPACFRVGRRRKKE